MNIERTDLDIPEAAVSARPWVRSRFHADADDWRAIAWPPPGPCWCSGYGDGYSVVVAYHRQDDDIRKWWPEASQVDTDPAPEGPLFTPRFPRPEWWHGDGWDIS